MADETPNAGNWKLLLAACALGLVVVVIYNVHMQRIRSASKGETITAYRYTRDIAPGEKITAKGMEAVKIPKQHAKSLGQLIGVDAKALAAESVVNQPVVKGYFVMWDHITEPDSQRPSNLLDPRNVGVPIQVDPNATPGRLLRVGDHVNLKAQFSVNGQRKVYRAIEGLKVVGIGGEGMSSASAGRRFVRSGRGVRSYRTITVEMTPDVSLQWANLETHIYGKVVLELCSRNARADSPGKIHPELEELSQRAAPVAR